MKAKHYKDIAIKYAEDVTSGKQIAGAEIVAACQRFLDDLKRDDLEFRTKEPDAAVTIIEGIFVHRKGEALDGTPLLGKPFLLQPFQIFIVYNLLGFYYAGTNERRFKESLILLARKNGKALSLDTEIATPEGFKLMQDIHPGDFVFGADGQASEVICESEIFHKEMYLVEFEDGTQIKASGDHIWTVQTKNSRRTFKRVITFENKAKSRFHENCGWFDITTAEMLKDFSHTRPDGKGIEYKYRVPMAAPVEYSEKVLPVDPYTLGVWLGDGTSDNTTITCDEKDITEMVEHLTACGHNCKINRFKKRASNIALDMIEKKYTKKGNPLRNALRAIGVFENKHIPELYLHSSIEQRMELLRGLMDTDGFCSKRGQCEFSQKNEKLVDEFRELLASLGIKSSKRQKTIMCNGKKCRSFSVLFYCDKTNNCFKLKRKSERLKDHLSERMKAKSIVDITRIPTEPSKCIMIDNPSHLYLATRSYTATHNTSFIAALSFAVAIIQRKSGSTIYVVAAALKQALETFNFLVFTLKYKKMIDDFEVKDNSFEHSIKYEFKTADGRPDGTIEIQVMASNPDAQDSFNCNFAIADEVAAYKKAAQYNRFKEAMKSYTNKLMIGITTAGDNINSFGYDQMQYAVKVAKGIVKDDSFFAFVARADQDEKGNVDYTNPIQHQKANPNYGVTIRPQEILNDALQAQNNPRQRKDFLSRSLNIYTAAMKAWFDIDEFRASDKQYKWTLKQLSKMPIDWFGGADLSRMYDLTAAALFGNYNGVDIIITHAFCPVVMAVNKAEEDNIPLYGWMDDGWLTMCNSPTVNIADIVNWFISMREMGFKIKEVGHDRKFAGEEYFPSMKKAGFKIIDQPQYYYLKSQGFRHIEKAAKDGKLYYLHSEAYEYCVSNVAAIEKTDDAVQYEKIQPEQRIDLFDASVFACIRCIQNGDRAKKGRSWWGEE